MLNRRRLPGAVAALGWTGSSPFTMTGAALDQDVALVDAGLNFGVTDNLNITADYTGSFGERLQDHTFAAKLRARFKGGRHGFMQSCRSR
ncbi:autotransporter outer membrane beta-barrel domain-containing protein [Labrenzia sp. 5N]|uniref:autotransporter outer membrane beta-barrel domain-containing protein n=1 Tax=Labrenzia sp. 5N TaxID=2723402 RepID=UPI0014459BC8|nr:autotransporter outer membrane beta-barrel domain-containing protein [Labrenzia sp. 5N]NKX65592.1 autotransporter outer membrane beta-barrel domain-containing protein [Labrenzia sp. 5N]